MKRSARPARTPHDLSGSTLHRLNMYALTAGAAGVAMLAVAPPADAKIIYTPANVAIPRSTEIDLDLNHDGIADFYFFLVNSTTGAFQTLLVSPIKSRNQIWGSGRWASALHGGVRIGFKGRFPGGHAMATWLQASGNTYSGGPWKNVKHRYLGLKFLIRGKIHFGWARLNVAMSNIGITATLTGYAYETLANTAIVAGKTKGPVVGHVGKRVPASFAATGPQPATLGVLAMGAPGVSIWRKKDQ